MRFVVAQYDDGNPNVGAFDEICEALAACLRDLGHGALHARTREPSELQGKGRLIVVGACRRPGMPLPEEAVIYNTEQVGSPWFTPQMLALYRSRVVWEYSAHNASLYPRLGLPPPVVVPFGWHRALERFKPDAASSCDVLMVGTLNDRRRRVLDECEALGLRTHLVDSEFGAARDRHLASARLLLNAHYYESAIFESARCAYAAANGVAVLSEVSAGLEGPAGVEYADYADLAARAKSLVDDPQRLELLRANAQRGVRAAPMIDGVSEGLRRLRTGSGLQRVVLSMVLTDEEKVLPRALRSALPHVGAWCISYNGKGEGTPRLIHEALGHLPGRLHRRPWVSYGHNRNEALGLAREHGSHALILDADEVVEEFPEAFDFQQPIDGWEVEERMGTLGYPKIRVVRLSSPWRYEGSVHEYLHCEGATVGRLPAAIRNLRDGAGSEKPAGERYLEEAKMLQAQLERNKGDARAQFYLAQSLELAGYLEQAIVAYARRTEMIGWDEERFMALLRVAHIYSRTSAGDLVHTAYMRAWLARPTRAEPLFYLSRWHRHQGQFHAALLFARQASQMPIPAGDKLFLEPAAYFGGWMAYDELALALGGVGRHSEAWATAKLAASQAPDAERERLLRNAAWFKAEVDQASAAPP